FTFAAALLIFAALNLTVAAFDRRIALWKDADSFVWHTKANKLLDGRLRDVDVLILGDSQTMSGVVPQILEKATGRKFYNFGLPAQQPEGMESIVRLLKKNT